MGLFHLSSGLGALIAAAVSEIAQRADWYCHTDSYDYCNPNSGKMYYYFWILALLQLVAIVVFYALAAVYRAFRERGEVGSWRSLCFFLCRS